MVAADPGGVVEDAEEAEVTGPITHTIAEDGLSIVSTAETPRGTMRCEVGWRDLEAAQAHYDAAREGFEKRIAKLASVQVGEKRRVRVVRTRVGTFFVHVNTGPPTWWKPDIGWTLTKQEQGIKAGWLRLAVKVLRQAP